MAPVQASDYAIGAGDRIEISVLSRPELSRIYQVRLDGSISMHIVGSIEAAGRTPAELESFLEARLREVYDGTTSTTIEVAEYRPVIVTGQVADPGAYPFQAGLTVTGAVALAGGLYRLGGDADVNAQMRVESEVARHALMRARLAGALVERARLLAERDGRAEISVPDEARAILRDSIRDLASAQAALRQSRDDQASLRAESGAAALELAEAEAAAYAERQGFIRRQLDATLEELEAQRELSTRGLALTQRLLDLRLSADDYRADELQTVALEAEARQRAREAEAGIEEIAIARARDVSEALAALDAEILEMRVAMDHALRFVRVFAGTSLTDAAIGGDLVYTIHRRGAAGTETVAAAPDMPLRPGDMVEVAHGDPADPAASGEREMQ
ncbi:polysaccharide biosynthesis/export family protein [Roseivivax sp. CAU 1761]